MGKLYETETWPEGSSGNATRAKYGRRTKWRIRLAGEKLNVLWQSVEERGEERRSLTAFFLWLQLDTCQLLGKKAKQYLIFILNGFLLAICCLLRSDLLTCLGRRWQAPLLRSAIRFRNYSSSWQRGNCCQLLLALSTSGRACT